MAYSGIYDTISLCLSAKLLIFALLAAFTDSWHPALYQSEVSPNLVIMMGLIFLAMLLSIINLVIMLLTIFVTEAVRNIAFMLTGSCAFFFGMGLLTFANSVAGLTCPWLLVMVICPLSVMVAHLVLTMLNKIESAPPLYKLVLACLLLAMSLASISMNHWWIVDAGYWRRFALYSIGTVNLFSLPSGGPTIVVQVCAVLTFVSLLALAVLYGVEFAVHKSWLSSSPFSEFVSIVVSIAVTSTPLVFATLGVIAYSIATYYTSSLLAAICVSDAAMTLIYQVFSLQSMSTDQ